MPIPDFQTLMLPVLEFAADGLEHSSSEVVQFLAQKFQLTDSELLELLPSGKQPIFNNRVAWARAHLKMAGLLEIPRRSIFKISDRGQEVLHQRPSKINVSFLKQFPGYLDSFSSKSSEKSISNLEKQVNESDATPFEMMDFSFQKIQKALVQEILDRVLNLTPQEFEKLVVDLIVRMGYGGSLHDAGKAIGKTNDEGIDGIVKEDRLGLDMIYLQAKRWKRGNQVGRPEIQKFVGALAGQGAKKGIFITTSSFSREAREYSPKNETKIVLLDGEELAQLMVDYNLGVSTISTYEIKRIDNDYFGEE
ncbi:MAG: restriction endonuclease [Saprospiraceae bacterium]|nr:restriction endonuclease [Saprospiraceae bacterium]